MELCHGNLDEYVRGRAAGIPKGFVDPKLINGQVTVGLSYLHAKGIVHRDLKPTNILMCRISSAVVLVKIADFGISKQERGQPFTLPHVMDVQESSDGQSYGTSGFMAPESLSSSGSPPNFESDVWALGVVIFFVLSDGQHPFGRRLVFGSQDFRDTIIQKVKILRNVAPIVYDWAATDLVMKLLEYDPAKRPSVFTVLYHPYFTLTDKRKKLFLAKKMFQLAVEHQQGHSLFRRMFQKQKIADWCASYCAEQSTEEDEQCLTLLSNVFLVVHFNSFHFEFLNI
jgi:serine/threonine-protein kinase/endoribonuclease IRE1